ncbi:MAG: hypothetical protein ACI88C_000440 [Acidimicrobiales bacterium]|jgi:hypothetical protein
MSYMSVLQCRMADLSSFSEAWNGWAKEFSLSTGATGARLSQTMLGGDQAGMILISFDWESIDAAMTGLAAMNNDGRVVDSFKNAGVAVQGRSLMHIDQERGAPEGAYFSAIMMTGSPISPEEQTLDIDRNYGILSHYSVNGMRLMQAVAAGEMTGAFLNVTYTNSLDQLMVGSKEVFSNPEMLAQMQKHDIQIHRRSFSRML